jgi:8-oxo-dGTP diphosphatase
MSPIVQAAVKGLVVKDGKFLILQKKTRDNKIRWDLPGGRIKYGEDPVDSLKREVFEETNLEVEIGKPIGVWHFFWDKEEVQVVCTTFVCEIKGGSVDIGKNPENDEIFISFHWFAIDEFLKNSKEALINETLKKIILDYFKI